MPWMFFSSDINPCLKQEIDSQKLVVFTWLFPRTHTKNNLSCSVFPVKTKRLSFKTSVYPKNLETYNHLSQWNLSGHDVKIIHDFIVIQNFGGKVNYWKYHYSSRIILVIMLNFCLETKTDLLRTFENRWSFSWYLLVCMFIIYLFSKILVLIVKITG